ncbi:chorion class high-cysteine HCA protein 12-like [Achroia grisella]|uniref:chorion class high-cysteine HCA protein 12-like n=1 Tax=Achroia grisella TaxID=688607 RepID=UPI0027D2E10D|nr:chorion class high-cysteine HCA protein 12-like [Achroia grisella]
MASGNKNEHIITTQPTSKVGDLEHPETLISEEERQLEEERKRQEEERRRQDSISDDALIDCCFVIPDEQDTCWCLRLLSDCCVWFNTCNNSCFQECANCLSNCCDGDTENDTGHGDGCCNGSNDEGGCDCGENCCDCGDNCCDW